MILEIFLLSLSCKDADHIGRVLYDDLRPRLFDESNDSRRRPVDQNVVPRVVFHFRVRVKNSQNE